MNLAPTTSCYLFVSINVLLRLASCGQGVAGSSSSFSPSTSNDPVAERLVQYSTLTYRPDPSLAALLIPSRKELGLLRPRIGPSLSPSLPTWIQTDPSAWVMVVSSLLYESRLPRGARTVPFYCRFIQATVPHAPTKNEKETATETRYLKRYIF